MNKSCADFGAKGIPPTANQAMDDDRAAAANVAYGKLPAAVAMHVGGMWHRRTQAVGGL
jgi:hypothetical protein